MSKWTTNPEFGSRGRFRNDPTARYIQRKYAVNGYITATGMGEFGAVREIVLRESCPSHQRPWSERTTGCNCDTRSSNLLNDAEAEELLEKIENELDEVVGHINGEPVTRGELYEYYDNYGS